MNGKYYLLDNEGNKSEVNDPHWDKFEPEAKQIFDKIESYMDVVTSNFNDNDKVVMSLNIYFSLFKSILNIVNDNDDKLGKVVIKEYINNLIEKFNLNGFKKDD